MRARKQGLNGTKKKKWRKYNVQLHYKWKLQLRYRHISYINNKKINEGGDTNE